MLKKQFLKLKIAEVSWDFSMLTQKLLIRAEKVKNFVRFWGEIDLILWDVGIKKGSGDYTMLNCMMLPQHIKWPIYSCYFLTVVNNGENEPKRNCRDNINVKAIYTNTNIIQQLFSLVDFKLNG